MKFDLAISYTWIYDTEFTQLIEKMFQEKDLRTFIINQANVGEVTGLVKEKKVSFTSYLDRASDVDENFTELGAILADYGCKIINHYERVEQAVDKSLVQNKLIEKGLNIPETIIIPPFDSNPKLEISDEELQKLGIPFIVKPAYYSGGSEGVNKNAASIEDISITRKENPDDNYLVQRKIYPAFIKGHRTWFRVFWAFGKIIPMLWDDEVLLYSDEVTKNIFPDTVTLIEKNMRNIYEVTKLDYFSSEFALDENNELFLIDYVNDQCDMRLKSNHRDGVPNKVVEDFIEEFINFVRNLDHPQ